jgi:hypothetical protein
MGWGKKLDLWNIRALIVKSIYLKKFNLHFENVFKK